MTLVTFALQIIGGLVLYSFTRAYSADDKTKEEIKLKADKTYVDKQDDIIRLEVKEVKSDLKESVDVIRGDVKEIRNYIMNKK